jgi:hypothetical protein
MIEKISCHRDAMGILPDSIDEAMVGGDMSLKEKIVKDRKTHIERKSFEEKRNTSKDSSKLMLNSCWRTKE